ncbi:MAG: hypothetical protein QXL94_06570, partial [Candidatus Parvarchaeum sp.]
MKFFSYNYLINSFSVLKNKSYMALFAVMLIFIGSLYYYLLSSSAEGIIDFGSYYVYFDIAASIIISLLISLVITLTVYSYKIKVKSSKKFSLASIISALLPSSLCCTSIVPSILAFIGFSTPFVLGNTGKIQSIFSIYGPLFIALGAVIAWIGLMQITKNISTS